jgi:hypothetical protein
MRNLKKLLEAFAGDGNFWFVVSVDGVHWIYRSSAFFKVPRRGLLASQLGWRRLAQFLFLARG